jgi:hypothetical protein
MKVSSCLMKQVKVKLQMSRTKISNKSKIRMINDQNK